MKSEGLTAPRMTSFLALWALFACLTGSTLASETLVKRRVLQTEKGFAEFINKLNDYELHDFSNHGPTRRALSSAGEIQMNYDLQVLGRRMTLELERHDELFAEGYQHHYIDADGNIVKSEPQLDCIYKGGIVGDKHAQAIVSLCDGVLHATVNHPEEDKSFTIQPLDEHSQDVLHVAYRHRDLKDAQRYCGVGRTGASLKLVAHDNNRRLRQEDVEQLKSVPKKSHFVEPSAGPRNRRSLDSTTKFVGVSVVNDKKRFDNKQSFVHAHSAQLMGVASALYEKIGDEGEISSTLKFRIQIVSMYTFVHTDPWEFVANSPTQPPTTKVRQDGAGEVNADDMLAAFEAWRSSSNGVLPDQDDTAINGHDLAHLLTGYNFQTTTIGLAYLRAVCKHTDRSGETQTVDLTDAHISSTITHEIGHNLGSQHTNIPPSGMSSCEGNAAAKQIMAAGSATAFTNWDACTIEYFRRQFDPANNRYPGTILNEGKWSKCAEAEGALWSTSPTCGDGLVQGDEECDCINKDCSGIDSCCDGNTCKLKPGAECSELDGCCSETCQINVDTDHVCRPAVSECDIEERCDGVSGRCPFDMFNDTGTPCTTEQFGKAGTCFSKKCVDHDEECTVRGLSNSVAHQWTESCRSETATESPSSNDCVLSCRKSPGSCEAYEVLTYFEDGTQCSTGKGCYQGNCIDFDQIPVLNNPKCANGEVDQEETDTDCGGPNCFGCLANQLCADDEDCIFPGFCNKTEKVDANGYTDLGRCTATGKPGTLEDILNDVLEWFRNNPHIWGPIVGALALLCLCCICPRGGQPSPMQRGVQKAASARNFVRPPPAQKSVPDAIVVKE